MKRKLAVFVMFAVASQLVLSGCTSCGWTSGESVESLIDDGNREMRDGEYAAALVKFSEAMAKDSLNSDARFLHAKASLFAAGFNVLQLATIMTDSSPESGRLPFTGAKWTANDSEQANSLYGVSRTVYSDLRPIFYNETHGAIDSAGIDFDFAIAAGLKGILLFQDTNIDGKINSMDISLEIVTDAFNGDFTIINLADLNNALEQAEISAFVQSIDTLLVEASVIILDIVRKGSDSILEIEEIEELIDDVRAALCEIDPDCID